MERYQEPFVALLLNQENEVVSVGVNEFGSNPLMHSEMKAINDFIEKSKMTNLENYKILTSAEPCSMCQSAIIWANIREVQFAVSRETLVTIGWKNLTKSAQEINESAPLYKGKLIGPLSEDEFISFFQRRANGEI